MAKEKYEHKIITKDKISIVGTVDSEKNAIVVEDVPYLMADLIKNFNGRTVSITLTDGTEEEVED